MQFKDLTTFKIGGPIKHFFEVKNDEEIIKAGKFAKENNLKIFILGGGSDILVSDKGFDGIVIKYIGDRLQVKGDRVTAEAGVIWDELVKFSVDNNLQGLECMSGIPGTVGASPVQNIGAYGQEVKDTLFSLRAFEFDSGKFINFLNADCEFGYRESFFKKPENWQKYLITFVTFKLKEYKDNDLSLQNIRDEILRVRNEKLEDPKEVGNAGSFFKNPVVENHKLSAGSLIDKAGWKGKSFKGAAVSSKNALI
ncbi:MAG: UDP-N-acetylmuramate dehydrogenase, partial [Candidatus Woesebacteria bacterium]|nr:UDP-N-acetylmuramate dehydrogenase [Candidatus Woesebacteria bacterium]